MKNNLVMRDVFMTALRDQMRLSADVFLVTADFGSPMLDVLVEDYPERFVNAGIAEQNLVNISAGMALEGTIVYAYAIAPFISMRCYEQVRINLSLLSHLRPLNVNLVGVGAGFSYDMSGPTHQSLEDLSIMRVLPNIDVFSPADNTTVLSIMKYAFENKKPKYLRLDGKPLPEIYADAFDVKQGFTEIISGSKVVIVATGYMTHKALKIAREIIPGSMLGVIDMYSLTSYDLKSLAVALRKYESVITMEEGFTGRGGLDGLIVNALVHNGINIKFRGFGVPNRYSFESGDREYLHEINGLGIKAIVEYIRTIL